MFNTYPENVKPMAVEKMEGEGELVCLGSRPLRDLGNCYGFTIDRDGLERAGLIDDDGNIPDDSNVSVFYRLYEDGSLEARLSD